MKLQFLCANHRNWLQDNPSAALNTWSNAYDRALELMEEHNYQEAVGYAGCAFEAAEIVRALCHTTSDNAIARFADSGVLLVWLLVQKGERRVASAVMGAAIGGLEDLLLSGVNRDAVLQGCSRLIRVGEDLVLAPDFRPAETGTTQATQARRLH